VLWPSCASHFGNRYIVNGSCPLPWGEGYWIRSTRGVQPKMWDMLSLKERLSIHFW
jgi:hypothetical protein